MNIRFHDLDLIMNPMNGARICSALTLGELTRALAGREPFLFQLRSDCGRALTIGLADHYAAVEHCQFTGRPPHPHQLMAVAYDSFEAPDGFVEFRAGGASRPIPARFCVSRALMETIATDFLADAGRSCTVAWEEIWTVGKASELEPAT